MHIEDFYINDLEETIINHYDGPIGRLRNYTDRSLLRLRKNALNHYALMHQEELLPAIMDFNQALKDALFEMYNRALRIWYDLDKKNEYGESVTLEARCYLDYTYPELHPVQNDTRQDLWNALGDGDWNVLYADGVTNNVLRLKNDEDIDSWNKFMLSDDLGVDNDNWNEGLDRELTAGLHLVYPFHHLFDHTEFALTDIIYVRKFKKEIKIDIDK